MRGKGRTCPHLLGELLSQVWGLLTTRPVRGLSQHPFHQDTAVAQASHGSPSPTAWLSIHHSLGTLKAAPQVLGSLRPSAKHYASLLRPSGAEHRTCGPQAGVKWTSLETD